jgi:hypothetical protein
LLGPVLAQTLSFSSCSDGFVKINASSVPRKRPLTQNFLIHWVSGSQANIQTYSADTKKKRKRDRMELDWHSSTPSMFYDYLKPQS